MTQSVDGYTIVAFLPFLVAASIVGALSARRSAHPWMLCTLTITSIGAIIAITIGGRMLKLTSWGRGDVVLSWLVDGASWAHVLEPDRTSVLNAVLFVPAGCLLTLTTRRSVGSVAWLSLLSFLIEVVQRWTRLGVADVSDLVDNIAGAAAGAAISVLMLRHALRERTRQRPARRAEDEPG